MIWHLFLDIVQFAVFFYRCLKKVYAYFIHFLTYKFPQFILVKFLFSSTWLKNTLIKWPITSLLGKPIMLLHLSAMLTKFCKHCFFLASITSHLPKICSTSFIVFFQSLYLVIPPKHDLQMVNHSRPYNLALFLSLYCLKLLHSRLWILLLAYYS